MGMHESARARIKAQTLNLGDLINLHSKFSASKSSSQRLKPINFPTIVSLISHFLGMLHKDDCPSSSIVTLSMLQFIHTIAAQSNAELG